MASKRRLRRKACEGKTRHATQEGAVIAAGIRSRELRQWLTPYKCKFCNAFHIGHPPKAVRTALRDKVKESK